MRGRNWDLKTDSAIVFSNANEVTFELGVCPAPFMNRKSDNAEKMMPDDITRH